MAIDNNNLREFDNFVIDLEKSVLTHQDEPIDLPFKAVELLRVLVENAGTVVTKEDLLDVVWKDSFVEESVLSQNVYLLRKTFKRYGSDKDLIQTVPRRGYRFFGEVSEVVEEETLTIEKEVIERQIIAEANVLEDAEIAEIPALEAKQGFFTKNKSMLLTGVGLIVLVIFGVGFWSYKNADSEQTKRLAKLNSQTLDFKFLTESGHATFPTISNDGKNIAYVLEKDEQFSIVLQNIATKSKTVVVEPVDYELRSIQFSVNGNYLYYAGRPTDEIEGVIYKVPVLGGTSQKIVRNIRQEFSISNVGNRFAFYRYDPKSGETHLMTAQTDGSDEMIIASRLDPKNFKVWDAYPSWSPDDKKIVAPAITNSVKKEDGKTSTYLAVVDVETGKEEIIKSPKLATTSQASWLNDGSGFIVLGQRKKAETNQFWSVKYPSGKTTQITNDPNNYTHFRLSTDSKTIIVRKRDSFANIYVIDKNDPSQVEQITNGTKDLIGRYGLAWTNDGKELVYTRTQTVYVANLWKINLKTKEIQQLTFDKESDIGSVKMDPNQDRVYFSSSRSGKKNIWRIDLDGEGLKQITTEEGGGTKPELSTDGSYLYYAFPGESLKELRKMHVEGGKSTKLGTRLTLDGKPIKVGSNLSGVSRISPTDPNKIIANFYDPNEMTKFRWKWILFDPEEEGEFTNLEITSNNKLEWSLDGKGVYFPKHRKRDMYYLSLEDKTEKPITNFKDQKVVNIAISPNGEKIAVSRQKITSDIIQITGFMEN